MSGRQLRLTDCFSHLCNLLLFALLAELDLLHFDFKPSALFSQYLVLKAFFFKLVLIVSSYDPSKHKDRELLTNWTLCIV